MRFWFIFECTQSDCKFILGLRNVFQWIYNGFGITIFEKKDKLFTKVSETSEVFA